MILQAIILIISLISLSQVDSAQQQVSLSDSYLPVAMQVIAHITDQMAFEVKEESTAKPTPKPTTRPTTKPSTQSTTRPTTSKPAVTNGWWTSFTTTIRPDITTPFHKPGLYAPYSPPKPNSYWNQHHSILLPVEQNSQYSILGPKEQKTEEQLLSVQHETIKPLVEEVSQSSPLLPPHYFVEVSSRSDGYVLDDISEDNLQYLSEDLREMIKMAHDPRDDKVVDVWEDFRQGNQPITTRAKLSATNLRLLLLYDLLSREAKRQRLSDYSGFSPDVMKTLVENSSSAREQLKMALSKMVERKDCSHEYANNRAREMVVELGKDESPMSAELRYLEPIVYKY